jgi:hypothetical protein
VYLIARGVHPLWAFILGRVAENYVAWRQKTDKLRPLPVDFLQMPMAIDVKTRIPLSKGQGAGDFVQTTRPVCFIC